YTIDGNTGQVVEFQGTTRRDLGGPSRVFAVSASIDPNTGSAEVFALSYYDWNSGPLWLCDSSGNWHNFGGRYHAISAPRDGRVYDSTYIQGDVVYLDSDGKATDLGAPSPHIRISPGPSSAARLGWFGQNEVFVLGASTTYNDNFLYGNSDNAPGQWRL